MCVEIFKQYKLLNNYYQCRKDKVEFNKLNHWVGNLKFEKQY